MLEGLSCIGEHATDKARPPEQPDHPTRTRTYRRTKHRTPQQTIMLIRRLGEALGEANDASKQTACEPHGVVGDAIR